MFGEDFYKQNFIISYFKQTLKLWVLVNSPSQGFLLFFLIQNGD